MQRQLFLRIPEVALGHSRLGGVDRANPSVKLSRIRDRIRERLKDRIRGRIRDRIRYKSSPAFKERIPSPRGFKGLFFQGLVRGSERL